MQIDLVEAEAGVERLKAELALSSDSCIGVALWTFKNGVREFKVRITVFDKSNNCQSGEGPTWEKALKRVRLSLDARSVDPRRESIELLVPDKSEDDKQS